MNANRMIDPHDRRTRPLPLPPRDAPRPPENQVAAHVRRWRERYAPTPTGNRVAAAAALFTTGESK